VARTSGLPSRSIRTRASPKKGWKLDTDSFASTAWVPACSSVKRPSLTVTFEVGSATGRRSSRRTRRRGTSGREATTRATIRSAAVKYFSASTGETPSTSPMLSNP
jgi:hypothetical protein